jgi:hypothetical protein
MPAHAVEQFRRAGRGNDSGAEARINHGGEFGRRLMLAGQTDGGNPVFRKHERPPSPGYGVAGEEDGGIDSVARTPYIFAG